MVLPTPTETGRASGLPGSLYLDEGRGWDYAPAVLEEFPERWFQVDGLGAGVQEHPSGPAASGPAVLRRQSEVHPDGKPDWELVSCDPRYGQAEFPLGDLVLRAQVGGGLSESEAFLDFLWG